MVGKFITFEGGEGSGKSTQIKRVAAHLQAHGHRVMLTREPGGTPQGEALRSLLVTGDTGTWSSTAEALLNNAARDAHMRQVIRPALARGDVVLCDRFMDSTRVYQGHAGDCPAPLIAALEEAVVGRDVPLLTLVFDLDPAVGLARARDRNAAGEDRYERKGAVYHHRLRDGFLAIARAEPVRCVLIDASATEDEVFSAVFAAVMRVIDG